MSKFLVNWRPPDQARRPQQLPQGFAPKSTASEVIGRDGTGRPCRIFAQRFARQDFCAQSRQRIGWKKMPKTIERPASVPMAMRLSAGVTTGCTSGEGLAHQMARRVLK